MSAKPDAVLSQRMMDAQVGVLGSMLLEPDVVPKVLSRIQETDFREPQYRSIFQAVQALFRAGKPVDPILVRETLGGGAESPWTELLTGIMDWTVTAANADAYIDALRESSTLFRLREVGDALSGADDLSIAGSLLNKAMQLQVGRPGVDAITFAEGYQQFFDRHDGETAVEYLDWGMYQLNQVLKAELGNVIIIGAYPSDGKTALALQFAASFGAKHRVGYFSFESKKERLFDRYVSRTAILSSQKINANSLTEEDYKGLLEMKDILTRPQVTLIDAVGMTALDIVSYSQSHHYDVVIVDYLQQVEQPAGPLMKDFERVTQVSRELQKFAVRTNTAVLSLSQLSRADKVNIRSKDEDGNVTVRTIQPPPTMGDLRSSGQIEQDADIILLMWREDYDLKDSNRIIQVAKNRNGVALDKVRCRFDGDHQTFSRISPRPEPAKKERQTAPQVSFWPERPDPDNPFLEASAK